MNRFCFLGWLVVTLTPAGCSTSADERTGSAVTTRPDAGRFGSGGASVGAGGDASVDAPGMSTGGTIEVPRDAGRADEVRTTAFACGPLQCSDASPCARLRWPAPHCDQIGIGHGFGTSIMIGCGFVSIWSGSNITSYQEIYRESGELVGRRAAGFETTCEDSRPDVRSATTSPRPAPLDCPTAITCNICSLASPNPTNAYWCTSEDGGGFAWVPPDGGVL